MILTKAIENKSTFIIENRYWLNGRQDFDFFDTSMPNFG